MAADLRALPDLTPRLELRIERAGDSETLQTWSRTLTAGYGLPDFVAGAFADFGASQGFGTHAPLRNYLAWWRGEAVATSSN
jgi:hypothetical protein